MSILLVSVTKEVIITLLVIIPVSAIVFILVNVLINTKHNKKKNKLFDLSYGINKLKPLYFYRPIKGHYLGRFHTETIGGITINSYDGWLIYYNTYPTTFDFILVNDIVISPIDNKLKASVKAAALKLKLIDTVQLAKYDSDHNEVSILNTNSYLKGINIELNEVDKGSQGQ